MHIRNINEELGEDNAEDDDSQESGANLHSGADTENFGYPENENSNLVKSLKEIHESTLKIFDKLCITFEWSRLRNLRDVISNTSKILHIVVNFGPTILSCIKVFQILGRDAALYVSLKDLKNINFSSANLTQNIVVDCENENKIPDNVKNLLNNTTGLIFLITSPEVRSVYPTVLDLTTLRDLEVNSQSFILEKLVSFQGYTLTLSSLIYHHNIDKEFVNSDVILKLLNDEIIVIGEQLNGPLLSNYIPRSLQRGPIVIQREVLNEHETFAVCGTDREGLQNFVSQDEDIGYYYSPDEKYVPENCKLFALGDVAAEENFKCLCAELRTTNIHLLRLEYDNLTWICTKGSTVLLRENIDILRSDASENVEKYMKSCNTVTPQVNTVWDVPESLLLISSPPGMGKSTHLSHLAIQSKKHRPMTCIIRANLSHFKLYFKDLKKVNINIENAYEFLLKTFQGNRTENADFCKLLLRSSKNIIILLDGFDDITSEEVEKAISLMRVMRTTGIEKLWLVGRPFMKKRLIRGLSVVCYSLLPFNRSQQKLFLCQCLRMKIPDVNINTISDFVSLLLLPSEKRSICIDGVPLHAIIFAECFEDFVRTYEETGTFEVPEKITLVSLLSAFVHKYRDTYNDVLKSNPNLCKSKSLFISVHVKLAMATVLSHEDLDQLHNRKILATSKRLLEETRDILSSPFFDKIGDDFIQFKHRIYAEFFVALWFIKNYNRDRIFMEKKFFTWDYREIRTMFDSILADDYPLHEAVLSGDVISLKYLLSTGANVNDLDDSGRTPLHILASVLPSNIKSEDPSSVIENIAQLLFTNGADMSIRDEVFQSTPLEYIYKCRAWTVYEVWLERVVDFGLPTYKELLLIKKADNPFYLAAINGYVNIISFALDNGLPPNTIVFDANRSVLLHGAAYRGHLYLVDVLIRHKADLNVQDKVGMTALMIASYEGHGDIVRTLLKNFADADIQNNVGLTALHFAAQQGHLAIVKYLVKAGCSVTIKNDNGESAVEYAKNNMKYFVSNDRNYMSHVKSVIKYLSSDNCHVNCVLQ